MARISINGCISITVLPELLQDVSSGIHCVCMFWPPPYRSSVREGKGQQKEQLVPQVNLLICVASQAAQPPLVLSCRKCPGHLAQSVMSLFWLQSPFLFFPYPL